MASKLKYRNTRPEKSRKQRVDELDVDRIRDTAKDSGTITELCRRLGFYVESGPLIKERMTREGIDFSHFRVVRTRPLEEILVKGFIILSSHLKPRLLRAKLLVEICSICSLGPFYNNKKLVLQMDHIDGDKDNQEITNLRILCPNCHSQTPTYCARNMKLRRLAGIGKRPDIVKDPESKIKFAYTVKQRFVKSKRAPGSASTSRFINPSKFCPECSIPINNAATRCAPCSSKASRKVERPSLETLLTEIGATSFKAVGRKYGVTDNTIRKWIKNYQKVQVLPISA